MWLNRDRKRCSASLYFREIKFITIRDICLSSRKAKRAEWDTCSITTDVMWLWWFGVLFSHGSSGCFLHLSDSRDLFSSPWILPGVGNSFIKVGCTLGRICILKGAIFLHGVYKVVMRSLLQLGQAFKIIQCCVNSHTHSLHSSGHVHSSCALLAAHSFS